MYETHTKTREKLEEELRNAAYIAHQITTSVDKRTRKERMRLLADTMQSAKRLFAILREIEGGLD